MSAPPIRIESKAWTDSRYAALALRLGIPRAEFALVLIAQGPQPPHPLERARAEHRCRPVGP